MNKTNKKGEEEEGRERGEDAITVQTKEDVHAEREMEGKERGKDSLRN